MSDISLRALVVQVHVLLDCSGWLDVTPPSFRELACFRRREIVRSREALLSLHHSLAGTWFEVGVVRQQPGRSRLSWADGGQLRPDFCRIRHARQISTAFARFRICVG